MTPRIHDYYLLPHWHWHISYWMICVCTTFSNMDMIITLICTNLSRAPAHHALARLPDSLASQPLSRALTSILTAAQERKHNDVYRCAQALHAIVQDPSFFDQGLGGLTILLTETFVGKFKCICYIPTSPFSQMHFGRERFRCYPGYIVPYHYL